MNSKLLVRAFSKEEAVKKIGNLYGYPPKFIVINTVKEPYSIFFGLIKVKGIYQADIEIVAEIESIKKVDESYKNGYAEIKNGTIKVVNPMDDGRYPSLIVEDPNIEVYINDERMVGALIVTESDNIEFKPINIEPSIDLSIEILNEKMQAVLTIKKQKGKLFHVVDKEKNVSVSISTGYDVIEPKEVTIKECLSVLTDAGIKEQFIDIDAIKDLLSLLKSSSALVAKGIEPTKGEKTKIKYYFDSEIHTIDEFVNKTDEISLENNIVQIGDVLAAKLESAIQGKPGMNIMGEPIEAEEVKDMLLTAGEGVVILDDGTKAVATTSGRPVVVGSTISVIPVLIISNDINKYTGDIDFDGDIIIKGNIMDNMKVNAKGTVKVSGSVYNSTIVAIDSIDILGRVIGSKIRSGISLIEYYCVLPNMEKIEEMINELLESAESDDMKFRKLLLTKKKATERYLREIEKILIMLEEAQTKGIFPLLKKIKKIMLRFEKVYVEDHNKIVEIYDKIVDYVGNINNLYANETYVSLEYAQNSIIQACGRIIVRGQGSYISNLFAKDRIIYEKYSSEVKGGVLIAGKGIKAGTLGSDTGIRTYCKVLSSDGKIDASFKEGTIVTVCDKTEVINFGGGREYSIF